eukprot:9656410-Prorocentrum_lima.AAC.1
MHEEQYHIRQHSILHPAPGKRTTTRSPHRGRVAAGSAGAQGYEPKLAPGGRHSLRGQVQVLPPH